MRLATLSLELLDLENQPSEMSPNADRSERQRTRRPEGQEKQCAPANGAYPRNGQKSMTQKTDRLRRHPLTNNCLPGMCKLSQGRSS